MLHSWLLVRSDFPGAQSHCCHKQQYRLHLGLMFDYETDRRKIAKVVHLCYDETARGDLAVRLVTLKSGERLVLLFQEPDKPFERGFVREQIPEEEFGNRFINGRSLTDLIQSGAN